MKRVKTAVITGYGINADYELEEAFRRVGADAGRIHITRLFEAPELLDSCDILAFPGGFSFGDHLGSGLVFANLCKRHLKERLELFLRRGSLVLGICNGFQVLVKMGILPNIGGNWNQEVTLVHNDSGVFVDSWVKIGIDGACSCIWTEGLADMELPIRHGEGRFLIGDDNVRTVFDEKKLTALRYLSENPNGSEGNIAGITDPAGRILGLMPHPEAFLEPYNHPNWKRISIHRPGGLEILRNGVRTAEKI